MKITLHDNSMSVRGTTVALYDYAYFLKHMYGIECSILFDSNHPANDLKVVEKFAKEFSINCYTDKSQINFYLQKNKADAFFMIKCGKPDGIISSVCKNWINAISVCSVADIHGDRFAMGSKWLSDITGSQIDYVPYMVNLPEVTGDLRRELNIPNDAIVFGRNGGHDSFDLSFVKQAITEAVREKDNIYFIFQGTDQFAQHERIIFLPSSPDLITKVRFINTSDACLHARQIGESFGLTCAEFSSKNKPVITWSESRERNHIDVLGKKGIYYKNYEDVKNILLNFTPDNSIDWNCYKQYYPEPVMSKFKNFYIDSLQDKFEADYVEKPWF